MHPWIVLPVFAKCELPTRSVQIHICWNVLTCGFQCSRCTCTSMHTCSARATYTFRHHGAPYYHQSPSLPSKPPPSRLYFSMASPPTNHSLMGSWKVGRRRRHGQRVFVKLCQARPGLLQKGPRRTTKQRLSTVVMFDQTRKVKHPIKCQTKVNIVNPVSPTHLPTKKPNSILQTTNSNLTPPDKPASHHAAHSEVKSKAPE